MPVRTRLDTEPLPRPRRQNTQLESAGAEFLVLGQLLIAGIPAFKSYTNTKGYDVIAANADRNKSVRLQVKSRWRTNAEGFIINQFDCDFVVLVLLNRGSRDGRANVKPPEFFVIPVSIVRKLPRSENWGKVSFSKFPDLEGYRERWDLVRAALRMNLGEIRNGRKKLRWAGARKSEW